MTACIQIGAAETVLGRLAHAMEAEAGGMQPRAATATAVQLPREVAAMRRHARKMAARATAHMRKLRDGSSFDVIAIGEAIRQHSAQDSNAKGAGREGVPALESQLEALRKRKEQVTRWVHSNANKQDDTEVRQHPVRSPEPRISITLISRYGAVFRVIFPEFEGFICETY